MGQIYRLETYETVTHFVCNASNCVHSPLICSVACELSVAGRRDRRVMAPISPFLCYAWIHHWRWVLLPAGVSVEDRKRRNNTVEILLLE